MPRVVECLNLRLGLLARRALEKYVVVRLAVERRIEVNEVHAFPRDLIPQDRQIVAIVERVQSVQSTNSPGLVVPGAAKSSLPDSSPRPEVARLPEVPAPCDFSFYPDRPVENDFDRSRRMP
jgi:hypothetical protein